MAANPSTVSSTLLAKLSDMHQAISTQQIELVVNLLDEGISPNAEIQNEEQRVSHP